MGDARRSHTAFSSAAKQKEVLDSWRAKAAQRSAEVDHIVHQISRQKKKSEQNAKNSRWMSERDSLHREQEICEAQLLDALQPLLSHIDVDVRDFADETQLLRTSVRQQLLATDGCLRTLKVSLSNATTDEKATDASALSLHERIAAFRSFLDRETEDLCELDNEDVRMSARSPLSTNLHALFATVRRKAETIRCRFADSKLDNIHALFTLAFQQEQETCEHRCNGETGLGTQEFGESVHSRVALVLKMSQNARRDDLHAASSTEVVQRVSVALPQLSRAAVERAIEETRRAQRQQQQRRLAAATYRRATEDLLLAYETSLEIQVQAGELAAAKQQEKKDREAKQQVMHEELAKQREAYQGRMRVRQAKENRAKEKVDARQNAINAKRVAEFQERLDRLAEYEAAREAMRLREAELASIRQKQEEAERVARTEYNDKRVEFRQASLAERQKAKLEAEKEMQRLQQAKTDALERFFASVDRGIGVQPSRERLLQATEASKQSGGYVPVAEAAFRSPGGYTDDQIMKDPRVKLYHALLEAGLQATSYGREVVSRGYRVAPAQQASDANPLRHYV